MTSFYATLRTRSRGALPLLSADSSPTLRGARGQAPCTPKIAPFRLPSSVTLFLGRSGPRKSVPQTNFFPQSLHAQSCVFARVLPLFLMSIDPHAGQQSGVVFVVLAWCRALPSAKVALLPMPHPAGTAPGGAQGTSPLTHYPPALKGARGGRYPPPAGFSVSAPSPSRVKMNGLRPPLTASRLGLCQ